MPEDELALATARAETAAAYLDRDALLALLASVYPARLYYDRAAWSLLVLETPAGATQWPICAANRYLFTFLPAEADQAPAPDGLHTEERRARLQQDAGINAAARENALRAYQEPAAAPAVPQPPKRRGRPRKGAQSVSQPVTEE